MAEGARRRLAHHHNEHVWLAWHVAAFSRQRHLVAADIRRLMVRVRRHGPQTWQEQMAVCRGIAAAYGGLH
jgi:hypothetical protein